MFNLDSITDHETFNAKGIVINRGDVVRVADSTIERRVMSISDRWGARLQRIDGGAAAVSVWTKQFDRIRLVRRADEDAAPKVRKSRAPKAAPVVTDVADDVRPLLDAIAEAVTAGDSVARNRAIVAAANAGVARAAIAAAAGLNKVGNIIRAAVSA